MGIFCPNLPPVKEKNMKKRVVLLIALLLCFVLVFAACKKKEEAPTGVSEIVLVSGGECKFVIVGDAEASYLKGFLTNVEKTIGTKPETFKTIEEAPADKVKVVVGNPNTLGLTDFAPEVPYFGYNIKANGGNLYVLAYDNSVLGEATGFLRMRIDEFYTDGNLSFAGDYSQVKDTSTAFGAGAAPYLEGGENARIFDCDTDYQMVLLEKVDKAEFEAYVAKLAGEGYALHSENNMNGNLFKTYSKDGVMLHTYWVEYSKQVRTIVAKTDLLPANSTGGNNSLTNPSVHQLKALAKNEQGVLDGGIRFVIELADGRFIIVDGGSENDADAKEIYNYLKHAATDPKNITIATWYISHYHGDHGGAFMAFAKSYASDSTIKIESFMYNQCMTPEQTVFIEPGNDALIQNAMSSYYPAAKVYKPLTGQKYTFSTTTIEILYTMPDFMPNVITQEADTNGNKGEKNGNGNTQTMVAMFDIVNNASKRDRLIITGDTTKVACDEMVARYKTYLKCDMVQVSHHGHGSDSTDPVKSARRLNSTKEFYYYTSPTVAFWPTGQAKYTERMKLSVNIYLQDIINKKMGTTYIAETSTNTTNTIVFG